MKIQSSIPQRIVNVIITTEIQTFMINVFQIFQNGGEASYLCLPTEKPEGISLTRPGRFSERH